MTQDTPDVNFNDLRARGLMLTARENRRRPDCLDCVKNMAGFLLLDCR